MSRIVSVGTARAAGVTAAPRANSPHVNSRPGLYSHWSEDPRKVRLMQWCTTPPSDRVPGTQAELAGELGVTNSTLINWMRNEEFREGWRQQAKDILGAEHVERVAALLDTVFAAAMDPGNRNNMTAAKLYFEVTKAIQPKRKMIANPEQLSDERLEELIAKGKAVDAEDAAIVRATAQLVDELAQPQPAAADEGYGVQDSDESSWRDDESGCPWPDES